MFKMFLGAAIVVALVGYGIITTQHIEEAGTRVVNGVNYVAKKVDEATR
jgi:hypothetical protein